MQLHLSYAGELASDDRSALVSSQDGTVFAARGTGLPRSLLTTGATLSLQASKATAISLGVDALINTGHVSAQSAFGRVNQQF